jgi:hypothetical protein
MGALTPSLGFGFSVPDIAGVSDEVARRHAPMNNVSSNSMLVMTNK